MRVCFFCRKADYLDFEFADYPREKFLGKPICAMCDLAIDRRAVHFAGNPRRAAPRGKLWRVVVDSVKEHETISVLAFMAETLGGEAIRLIKGEPRRSPI